MDDENYRFGTEKLGNGEFKARMRVVSLGKRNSPLRFRVYLTLRPANENNIDSLVVERSFYVSELIRTSTSLYLIFPVGNYRDKVVL